MKTILHKIQILFSNHVWVLFFIPFSLLIIFYANSQTSIRDSLYVEKWIGIKNGAEALANHTELFYGLCNDVDIAHNSLMINLTGIYESNGVFIGLFDKELNLITEKENVFGMGWNPFLQKSFREEVMQNNSGDHLLHGSINVFFRWVNLDQNERYIVLIAMSKETVRVYVTNQVVASISLMILVVTISVVAVTLVVIKTEIFRLKLMPVRREL